MGDLMHKLILMLLLVVASNNAIAEWVWVGTSSNNESFTIYADLSSIRKNGNKVKMWSLNDLKIAAYNPSGKPHLSITAQDEYDCKEEQRRPLAYFLHSGNMREGDVVYSNSDPEKWKSIPPESGTKALWKLACGVK